MVPELAFRHLRYFLAVAETENFTRAAERLGVTQPAVSQQVRDLERALGSQLLRRAGRQLQLTAAGRAFAHHAAWLLRKFETAVAEIGAAEHAVTGHLEIGVVPALHLAWVPPVLQRLQQQFPGVTVSVHERASQGIETEVEAGRFDLGLGIGSHPSPALQFERLLAQDLELVVRRDHALARRRKVAARELAAERLVLLPGTFDMRKRTDDLLQRARLHPRVAHELNTLDAVLATVVATGLATILPPVVMQGRPVLELRSVPLALRPAPLPFGVFSMRGVELGPPAREFVRLLREVVAPHARGPRRRGRR